MNRRNRTHDPRKFPSELGEIPTAPATGLAGIPPVCMIAGGSGHFYLLGEGKALHSDA